LHTPSFHPSVRIPRLFSATTGWNSTKLYRNHQYQEEMCILYACSSQTLQFRVMAFDWLCIMRIEQKSFPPYFSATTGWNSMKLYGNLQYQEKMRILLPCVQVRHFNSELWPLISYALCL
jgi:hypothetical protein